jgi:hypothetical protein
MHAKNYMAHVSVESIAPLIDLHRGNIAAIARQLNVARGTVWDRIKTSPELQAALVDARESMLDDAVASLHNKVLSGDTIALIFFLKTQGWRRGFAERKQLDVSVNEMEGHTAASDDTMTLQKWQAQQQRNIAQVKETMALFDEVYEDDDDSITIDGEITKTV